MSHPCRSLVDHIRRNDYFRRIPKVGGHCSCSIYWKKGQCKHQLARDLITGAGKIPDFLSDRVVKSDGRRKGRPRRARPALHVDKT